MVTSPGAYSVTVDNGCPKTDQTYVLPESDGERTAGPLLLPGRPGIFEVSFVALSASSDSVAAPEDEIWRVNSAYGSISARPCARATGLTVQRVLDSDDCPSASNPDRTCG